MYFRRWISFVCVWLLACTAVGCSDAGSDHTSTTTTSIISNQSTTRIDNAITTTSTTNRVLTTTTTARKTRTTTQTAKPRPSVNIDTLGSHIIDAPILAQKPHFPSGCEAVSAVMLLNYWGETITPDRFIDDWLPKSTRFYTQNGRYYGPDPYKCYVGDPRTSQGYGCMAPVIERAINDYYGNQSPLQNVSGLTLPQLCKDYIANDQPVLVWVSIGMIEIYGSAQWYLEDGTLFTWPANEHCMLLVGYDDTYYYFNDPYTGKLKKYAHWICEDRFNTLGQQALVIVK